MARPFVCIRLAGERLLPSTVSVAVSLSGGHVHLVVSGLGWASRKVLRSEHEFASREGLENWLRENITDEGAAISYE